MYENNKNSINSDIGLAYKSNTKLPEKATPSSVRNDTPSVDAGNTKQIRRDRQDGRINRTRKRMAALRKTRKKLATQPPQKKKMTGAGFYMVVGLAVIKDIVDFADFTGFGYVLTAFLGFIISYIVWFYLFYNDVKLDSRKLATFVASAIIEISPFNFFPTFSITLFIIREMENNPKLKKLTKLAKKKL